MSFICSTFSIDSLTIMFKWLLPLTSVKFFTSSSFFNTSAAVIFLFSSSSATIPVSSSDWLAALAASRTCSAKLEESAFQINSVYKSPRSCRGDWKESQSWFCIWTRNTSKLFFYGDARVITWMKIAWES